MEQQRRVQSGQGGGCFRKTGGQESGAVSRLHCSMICGPSLVRRRTPPGPDARPPPPSLVLPALRTPQSTHTYASAGDRPLPGQLARGPQGSVHCHRVVLAHKRAHASPRGIRAGREADVGVLRRVESAAVHWKCNGVAEDRPVPGHVQRVRTQTRAPTLPPTATSTPT